MDPLTIISSSLSSISSTNTLIQYLFNTGKKISEADLKLKVADIKCTLADMSIQMSTLQDIIISKDKEIEQLKNALAIKDKVTRIGSCYFLIDENEEPTGSPFCSSCWEMHHTLIHLNAFRDAKGNMMYCPKCNSRYNYHIIR